MAKLRVSPQRRLGIDLAGSEYELVRQLVAFRRQRGYTQAEVAKRMGVSRTTVSQFENLNGGPTKNHTLLTVKRYAEAVNAYVDHIAVDAGTAAEDGDRASYEPLRNAVIEHRKVLEDTSHTDAPTSIDSVLTVIGEATFTESFAMNPATVHVSSPFARANADTSDAFVYSATRQWANPKDKLVSL